MYETQVEGGVSENSRPGSEGVGEGMLKVVPMSRKERYFEAHRENRSRLPVVKR